MKRTKEEITKEVESLRELEPKVQRYTVFGDDNQAAIAAQIMVLEKRLTNDQIYDEWPEDESDLHVRSAALEALQWIDGESESETLSADWESLTT